jgi:phage terminase large subunit-like protein
VRLACRRHLSDLARQDTPGFPYHFEPARAERVFEFFRDYLTLDDGTPFELMPWLKFIFGSLIGWVNQDGYWRYRTSYTETAKGSAKTPAAAGFGLYCLVGENESAAEIYSLGVNSDQASYLFRFAKQMAERSEDLRDLLAIGEHNVAWVARNSFFRPLPAEGRSLDNKRPYVALVDELHEHPSAVIPEKMRLGFKGRPNALLFEITNAGHDKTSVCWEHHDYSMKVLEGVLPDDRWFSYICMLDPCEACRQNGATQPNDSCPDCDHWTDESKWVKVQPSLGVTMPVDNLREIVKEAVNRPGIQNRVKRLNFCLWTQAHTLWIPTDRWDACRVPSVRTTNDGRACAAAFDMSEKIDLTAGVVLVRVDDEPSAPSETIELTGMEGEEEIKRTLNLNFSIELTPFFWIPEDTLIERVKNERIPYDLWRQEGHLRVTKGPVVDHDAIFEEFRDDIGKRFHPQRVGYDPHNTTQFALSLRDKARYTVVEVPQGRKLSEAFKLFEALVLLRRIRHAGNPVMAWCVSNAEPKYDRYQNLWIEKPSRSKRIDGLIAAVIALSQLVLLPATRRRRGRASVWTPSGFRPLSEERSSDQPSV